MELKAKLNIDTKELDRLAIGGRLYDMLDRTSIGNKAIKNNQGDLSITDETIATMIELVNPHWRGVETYIISHLSYHDALEQASMLGIPKRDVIYVPMGNERNRQNAIMGRRVSDEKYLIGHFTEEEKEHLLRHPRSK